MRTRIVGAVSLILLMGGCSSEESTKQTTPDQGVAVVAPPVAESAPPTPPPSESVPDEQLVYNDSLIAFRLEQARQHYLSATRADENGDSLRTAQQFEIAINILNDLSYYPLIESNQDFNDISKTVVEDYEQYIRRTGVVDSTSSVFALQEKLNALTEQLDTASATPTEQVVTGTTIPLVTNTLVDRHVQFFTTRGRVHIENWLERAGKYFPTVKRILREEGVPEEIAYLAMVESGLNPTARSWARAVGMWQFMKGTGALYGLKQNFWYDDRRDFEKATRAAARHLKDLYEDFEDWYLVMAAYNSGAGKVYRAMRKSGSNDFWEMRRYLPRETRSYVPSYIAVSLIAMNPGQYGFDVTPADSLSYDYVTVDDCVDLAVLADCAATDVETLRELNPSLIRLSTPPSSSVKGYELRVPKGTDKALFKQKYSALPESKRMSWITHVVKRGDTLPKLARQYGISQQVLAEANGVRPRRSLRRGSSLMIPVSRDRKSIAATISRTPDPEEEAPVRVRPSSRVASSHPAGEKTSRVLYKVKKGDTLGEIAEWYGVRATDIRNWNNHPFGRPIQIGQLLTLWVPKSDAAEKTQINSMTDKQKSALAQRRDNTDERENGGEGSNEIVIRRGDTLEKIADDHGVSVAQIKRWNNLSSSRIIAGEKLVLYPVVKQVATPQAKNLADAQAKSEGKTKQIIYVVRRGDTIWQIAQQYDVQESQILAWNSLKHRSKIYAGQELIIRKDAN